MDARSATSNCVLDGESDRITVRFDKDLLNRVDECVEDGNEFHNRSVLIRVAVAQLLDEKETE